MDWRIVQYNPLSLLPSGRLHHILQEVGLQHFVGIAGTGGKLRHMIRHILLTNVVSIWFLIFLSDLDPFIHPSQAIQWLGGS